MGRNFTLERSGSNLRASEWDALMLIQVVFRQEMFPTDAVKSHKASFSVQRYQQLVLEKVQRAENRQTF